MIHAHAQTNTCSTKIRIVTADIGIGIAWQARGWTDVGSNNVPIPPEHIPIHPNHSFCHAARHVQGQVRGKSASYHRGGGSEGAFVPTERLVIVFRPSDSTVGEDTKTEV